MKIARILCPIDFSDTSRHAIEQAVVLAGYYHAQIAAMYVFTPFARVVAGAATGQAEASAIDRLRRRAEEECAAALGRQIGVEVIVDEGQPAALILERAASLPADLVVMGTHGATGFERLMLGSVTEKVLRRARCPVLTVPPRAQTTSRLPFTRLLCAVDFSDASLDAVRWALSLSDESGADLTLLHVVEWPWDEPPPPRLDELPGDSAYALTEFRRYLTATASKRLASLIPEQSGTARIATKVVSGRAYAQILCAAGEEQSDLIVIGVHGRNTLDLALFGSTASQVVRRASCPVLTLRQG